MSQVSGTWRYRTPAYRPKQKVSYKNQVVDKRDIRENMIEHRISKVGYTSYTEIVQIICLKGVYEVPGYAEIATNFH